MRFGPNVIQKIRLPRIMNQPKKSNAPASAASFLNYAREFYEGAEIVFRANPKLTRMLNANYFPVIELLLKAFLRATQTRSRETMKSRSYIVNAVAWASP